MTKLYLSMLFKLFCEKVDKFGTIYIFISLFLVKKSIVKNNSTIITNIYYMAKHKPKRINI